MKMKPKTPLIAYLVMVTALNFMGCRRGAGPASSPTSDAKRTYEPLRINVEKLTNATVPDTSKLIAAYNARNFGSPGWRRVLMELITDGSVTRTFTVTNLWRSFDDGPRTLFLLEEPEGLRGTSYLLQEHTEALPDMQVHLFLPAGERRVLEVLPNSFDEGLLGSDFSYNDVRMQLPTRGYSYTVIGQAELIGEPAWVIEAEPSDPQTRQQSPWVRARFYLARKSPFLLGADYYGKNESGSGEQAVPKEMRVNSLKSIDGSWTATRMTMHSPDKRWSELNLREANFNTAAVDAELFAPAQLPVLSEKIRQGWKPSDTARK